MLILSWNIQGLNKGGKLKANRDYTHRNNCDIICLLEHKSKRDMDRILARHWSDYEYTDNMSSDPLGRILVLWNKNSIRLNKVAESKQFIQLEASPLSSLSKFYISVVYGANDIGSRRQLWEDLLNSQPSFCGF